jgi:hypothetical protein
MGLQKEKKRIHDRNENVERKSSFLGVKSNVGMNEKVVDRRRFGAE